MEFQLHDMYEEMDASQTRLIRVMIVMFLILLIIKYDGIFAWTSRLRLKFDTKCEDFFLLTRPMPLYIYFYLFIYLFIYLF